VVIGVAGTLLCGALVIGQLRWPDIGAGGAATDATAAALTGSAAVTDAAPLHPVIEGLKLVVSALVGLLVTIVQKQTRRDKPLSRSMEHAQVLLCVSGAMMMIVIGNSLARAFGIAGAASIIRFRTPVDDPKDITILFLLMALGMATGLGAFAVAGLGTLFLCVALVFLDRLGDPKTRTLLVELVADGPEFPAEHVRQVFARHAVVVEPRELAHGDVARAKFLATVDAAVPLDTLSTHLVGAGRHGIRSVSWETKKAA
jgi:type III secretory pathway component EscS